MKGVALFAALASTAVLLAGAALALIFPAPADRRAIVVSGCIALAVQMITFVIARSAEAKRVTAMWTVGIIMRFVTLIVYALVILKPFALPAAAALISLATFFFITTLIEPRLLSV